MLDCSAPLLALESASPKPGNRRRRRTTLIIFVMASVVKHQRSAPSMLFIP